MKSMNLIAALALVACSAAGAQTQAAGHDAHHAASAAAATAPMTEGEVRKVDKEAGKVTLRHGPIANLDMPAMTMVFPVADARLLDGLKNGDKVRFAADKVNGAITVMAIQPAR